MFFLHNFQNLKRKNLKVMQNIMCGMILNCGNFVVIRLLGDAYLILSSSLYLHFVIHLSVWGILDPRGLRGKFWNVVCTGPPSFVMLIFFVDHVIGVNELET